MLYSFVSISLGLWLSTLGLSAEALQCPSSAEASELTAWRQNAAEQLQAKLISTLDLRAQLKTCFGPSVPSCLVRMNSYVYRNDTAANSDDVKAKDSPQKTLPEEFFAGSNGALVVPENIEEIAANKGWLSVRYKSRHSGGFDPETPSLLMIYVPGSSFTPPLSFDRWINIALPKDAPDYAMDPLPRVPIPGPDAYAREEDDEDVRLPRTLTMVSLERKGEASGAAQVYFQKFYRETLGKATFKAEGNAAVKSCYSCHPNGLRAISPLGYHVRDGETQMDAEQYRATRLINEAMDKASGHAMVSWREVPLRSNPMQLKPLLRPDAFGPALGPLKPNNPDSRTQAFILGGTASSGQTYEGCFQARKTINLRDIFNRDPGRGNVYSLSPAPTISWQKVARAMRCESCHNNKQRGALNDQISAAQIDFKILVDQSMPMGLHQNPLDQDAAESPVIDQLSGDERIALANCLQAEAKLERDLLAKWLTESSCQ